LIFAVLKQWLLQLKETGFSFVFIIFADLLKKIIRNCRSFSQDDGMAAIRHLALWDAILDDVEKALEGIYQFCAVGLKTPIPEQKCGFWDM